MEERYCVRTLEKCKLTETVYDQYHIEAPNERNIVLDKEVTNMYYFKTKEEAYKEHVRRQLKLLQEKLKDINALTERMIEITDHLES